MAQPDPSRPRRPPPPRSRHRPIPKGPKVSKARRRLALLVAPVMLVLLGAVLLRIVYTDRALPGVQLAGVPVEGDSRSALRERMTLYKAKGVTIFGAGQQLRALPTSSGYQLDVEATLDRVIEAGRDGVAGGLVSSAEGFFVTRDIEPVARVDQAALDAVVRRFARLVNRPAFPGSVRVDPATLEVEVQGPRQGRSTDRPALERALVDAFRAGEDRLKAPLNRARVASVRDVSAVGVDAERYLEEPLTLTGVGEPVVVRSDKLAPILRLRASSKDRTKVRLGSDEPALIKLVAGIAASRDRPARPAKLSAAGKAPVLEGKGRESWKPRRASVRVTREARNGRAVRREAAVEAIALAIRTGRHTAKVPTAVTKPSVTASAAKSLTSLIGTFTTRYEPGQARVRNIRRMARTVDGTLVAAGKQFSLNGLVGPRTKKGGYVEAPFIADGKIEPSVGGGVSQFSTTMYNAAYFAGLKVDTHQPHSLFIDRYPPGREATLNFPDIDLKWTNNTSGPIYVRAVTDERSVTVSLYGDNGGRTVTAVPGPRVPVPGGDFRIRVVRTVKYADGRSVDDAFETTYDKPAEE